MTLAEYLASEQAREDVRDGALELGRCRNLRRGIDFAWMRFDIVGMWRKVSIEQGQDADALVVTAYYRPDGDRYVVTDLNEGVRALRLKGVALREIKPRVDAVMMAMWQEQTEFVAHFPAALIEGEIGTVNHPKAESLPDAICRVMLASLRVAQS